MGGIFDFATSCPWQLYTFALIHILAGIVMFFLDVCRTVFPTETLSCEAAEFVMGRMVALCLLYVGVVFAVLTYHVKESPAKVTRLSNIALNGAVALLAAVLCTGNKAFGGFERSWMHVGDVLFFFILVFILVAKVSEEDAPWANRRPVFEGHGINCKTLLLLFVIMTFVKIIAVSDFYNPSNILADGVEMTGLAYYLWTLAIVVMFEILLGLFFSLVFDDDFGHELMVYTIAAMTIISMLPIYTMKSSLSQLYNSSALWVMLVVMLGLCAIAIIGGRMWRPQVNREGYEGI